MTVTIDLPWPAQCLSPNARAHWSAKAKAVKASRAHAGWAARAAGANKLEADRLGVTATFMPPDARRRDTDNLIASIKSSLDGLADATGIDDSKFDLTIKRGEIVRGGLVRMEIKPARAGA